MNWTVVIAILIGVVIVLAYSAFIGWIASHIYNDFLAGSFVTVSIAVPFACIAGLTA